MPSSASPSTTRTVYLPLRSVKVSTIKALYKLHEQAFEHTSLDQFTQELKRQTGVLTLQRQADERIVGFSTQTLCALNVAGETYRGLFTGPLVLDQEYRSERELRRAVFRRLFLERLKRPAAPFYWFFTATRAQDYLPMIHCFPHHFPSSTHAEALHRELVQAYCTQLFPHAFDRQRMLIDLAEGHARLKSTDTGDLPLSAAQRKQLEAFERFNPSWRQGTELPCLAECDWASLWRGMQGRVLDPSQRGRSGAVKRGQPS